MRYIFDRERLDILKLELFYSALWEGRLLLECYDTMTSFSIIRLDSSAALALHFVCHEYAVGSTSPIFRRDSHPKFGENDPKILPQFTSPK